MFCGGGCASAAVDTEAIATVFPHMPIKIATAARHVIPFSIEIKLSGPEYAAPPLPLLLSSARVEIASAETGTNRGSASSG